MTLEELNRLPRTEAALVLSPCCGSAQWAKTMAVKKPFFTAEELFTAADSTWQRLSPDDWKEAFSHHPKIGDVKSLNGKFGSTQAWAKGEQSGASNASQETLEQLAVRNSEYETRFGYIFIICATGKSAGEMLTALNMRLKNPPEEELLIAAEEQRKIMRLRLEGLFGNTA